MDISADAAFDPAESYSRRALERSKRRRPLSQRLRIAAKQIAEQHSDADSHVCEKLGLLCSYEAKGWPQGPISVNKEGRRRTEQAIADARRNHLRKDLKYQNQLETAAAAPARGPLRDRNHGAAPDEGDLELARSSVPLPSDRHRLQRHPSLGREDAFCDASTYKGRRNVHIQRLVDYDDEDAQIAELYRMGLLYDQSNSDDVKSTAAGGVVLTLNTIYHDEPSYTIRPAKRSRKLQQRHAHFNNHHNKNNSLDLDLSFADLGNDGELARYLVSPAGSTNSSLSSGDDAVASARGHHNRHTRKVSAPLRVVYELDNNSQPSFDVDTSQPPDLIVDDSLSDYDCFTDSDVDDDMPSQEVDGHDDDSGGAASATASGAWVLLGDDS